MQTPSPGASAASFNSSWINWLFSPSTVTLPMPSTSRFTWAIITSNRIPICSKPIQLEWSFQSTNLSPPLPYLKILRRAPSLELMAALKTWFLAWSLWTLALHLVITLAFFHFLSSPCYLLPQDLCTYFSLSGVSPSHTQINNDSSSNLQISTQKPFLQVRFYMTKFLHFLTACGFFFFS